jgi:hypothetical protein
MRPIHLPIAEPCHEDWDAMTPRERGRFCDRCSKDVHDLSGMTEDEAREFLRERAGTRICVNYRHHGDGRIQFRAPSRVATATATVIAATALAACTPHDVPRKAASTDVQHTMGEPMPVEGGTVQVPPELPPPPPPAPDSMMLGQAVAPPIEPLPMKRGDFAVPNEPCDPPAARAPEPEPERHMLKGDVALPKAL